MGKQLEAVSDAWRLPTRRGAAWFATRVAAQVLKRALRDLLRPPIRRHAPSDALRDAPVVAERRTPLWQDGRDDEFTLVAGKVHNLRIARGAFDGVVVPAGATLGFWRQLGWPGRWRGFVEGREVREGCVVPTIAGGLCQLSNALATCASMAGLALVERHGHTARVATSAGDDGPAAIDATVFWNYVDLRLAAAFDFRVEVELTADELVVRLRAARPEAPPRKPAIAIPIPIDAGLRERPIARGCLACDETGCFRHGASTAARTALRSGATTAVLAGAWTPELARHLERTAPGADWFVPWVRPGRRPAGTWPAASAGARHVAVLASLARTLRLRARAGDQGGRQAALLRGDEAIARSYARHLLPHHVDLVVDQGLLVPLARRGALGGRRYDVLVHALPAGELQRRLDAAAARWPDAASLRDFRVDPGFVEAELHALRGARRLVTPHVDVAAHLRALGMARVERIEWHAPPPGPRPRVTRERAGPPVIAFPASPLARKGALELAAAMRTLGWRLVVVASPGADRGAWQGIDLERVADLAAALARADVVALPAHVEHAPRALLEAIAAGLPVVATRACGLPPGPGLIEVAAGDVAGLVAALQRAVPTSC